MEILLILAVVAIFSNKNVESTIITLPLGQIEGFSDKSLNGRTFFSFEGVPFARPPVGKYRFKEPQPVKPWKGVIQAKTIYKCVQYNHFTPPGADYVVGEEDCLYLNIYTPNVNNNAQLDVIVYIHGGAFMFNYGGLQQPHYLMDKDVISITLNYRLGPLGFLSTEDDTIPGNNGIKDQIIALQWIKDNVKYFGGNPNSITIFGMSAGGASVHLHQLIPQSRGLFQKGISQSGCALNPWVLMEKPLEKTNKLANLVGCNFPNSKQLVRCLQKRPVRQIVEAVKQFQPWLYNPFSPFGVVIDSWSSNPILPRHPYELIKSGQVSNIPWIVSMTSSEGLYPASDFYFDDRLEEINVRWNELMPFLLDYYYTVELPQQNTVSEKIKEFYLKNQVVTKSNFLDLVKIFSDRLFAYDLEKATRLQASISTSPIYFYYFGYRGAHSRSEGRTGVNDNLGASHGDDTSYFYKTMMNVTSTENDRTVVNLFLEMFSNFAKFGQPKVPIEWKPLSKNVQDDFHYLKIMSPTDIKMDVQKDMGNKEFWNALPIKENDKLSSVKDEL